VLNGRTKIPVADWKAEQTRLTAHRQSLCEKFYTLKDEVRSVEALRNGAENIMREEQQRAQPARAYALDR